MIEETQHAIERHFDPVTVESMTQVAFGLWQVPMIISAAWWNRLLDAYRQQPLTLPRHVEPHDQLVVPEPIAKEGEHALFA